MQEITPQYLEQIRENPRIRRRLAYESPLWFSLLYLRHHFSYPFAPFHAEMFHLIENPKYEFIVVMAFRESGKSTVMNMANILWSILGKPGKKFSIIISKTQEQAKDHFANLKAELENNELLRQDFGPFTENETAWNKLSLDLVYHGSKILSATRDQSLRGLKHGQFRPDLIVCDDVEDISSVLDAEIRKSLRQRFYSEVVPLGSANTRIVLIGNFLSRDSLIMSLKDEIDNGKIKGIFRVYPLLDELGKSLWPGKFSDYEAFKELVAKLPREVWKREYLLNTDGWGGYHDQIASFYDRDAGQPQNEITRKADRRLAEIHRRYRDVLNSATPQRALIEQMKEFSIVPPANDELRVDSPDPSDSRYERYQKYKKEVQRIVQEFEDEIREFYVGKKS